MNGAREQASYGAADMVDTLPGPRSRRGRDLVECAHRHGGGERPGALAERYPQLPSDRPCRASRALA